MQRKLNSRAGLILAALLVAAPALAAAATDQLPAGVTVQKTADGPVLALDGKPLYRIDVDRLAKRRRGGGNGVFETRWAALNDGLWRPVAAPKDFKADGDWSVTQRRAGPQLTYKGDPLYSFTGKSLDDAAKVPFLPPYLTAYAVKPTLLNDGVPVATLYYHPVSYAPPAPKFSAPSGVTAHWSKVAYVFADAANHTLYAAKSGKACATECGGLKPFSAPLAALPVGEWRPVVDKGGERVWAYRGRIVYQAQSADADAPGDNWSRLEVR